MLNKSEEKRNQIQIFCIEDLVTKDQLLRKIERIVLSQNKNNIM